MRQLTPTERRLLTILLGAVFIALNLGGLKLILNARANHKNALAAAEAKILDSQVWIELADELGPMSRSLPPAPEMAENTAGSDLLQAVRAAAAAHGLTVLEESLPGPPEGLVEKAAVLRLKLSGPFQGAVRFLFDVQQQGSWRSIEQLNARAEASPQNILAEMEIRQYYSLPSQKEPAPVSVNENP
ncbi:MAG: hypothetical protein WEB60_05705 [Terrimicrobiaceae bacterium]